MEKDLLYKRGDLVYVNFSPVMGSEQDGIRPAVIIQNDIGNKFSPTLIVLPITSRNKKLLPTHISINDIYGLPKKSIILVEQIRTVDKKRIMKKIGKIDSFLLNKVSEALKVNFGIRVDIFNLIDEL